MSDLLSFLSSHRKGSKQTQTHTWFASGLEHNRVSTLHINNADQGRLRQLIVDFAADKRDCDLCAGILSVTEKAGGAFRFFADIDFKPSDISAFAATREETWKTDLVKTLQKTVTLFQDVVQTATGQTQQVVLATRLPYKIHLHFPDVVVTKAGALELCKRFSRVFSEQGEGGRLYRADALDTSVYTTGLRTLWSHKGGMSTKNPERVAEERVEHENLFGKGTWTGIYEITDETSWEKHHERSLMDLEVTSIIADVDATVLTITQQTESRQVSKKRKSTTPSANPAVQFLAKTFSIPADTIHYASPTRRGSYLIVTTRCSDCPFAKRVHQNNHLYLVLSAASLELRCHDEECTATKLISMEDIPREVRQQFLTLFETEIGEEMRHDAIERSLEQIQQAHPEMNLSGAMASLRPSTLGGRRGYMLSLHQNRYCPICKREHDAAENCILTTEKLQQIICKRTDGDVLSLPLATELGNVIFANINNFNVSVNVTTSDANEVKDFGSYDEFPRPYDDEEMNALCYTSLSGRTRDVAKYVSRLMQTEYLYQNKQWYRYTGKYWRTSLGPDDLMTGKMVDTYLQLRRSYRTDKQQRWINGLMDDLSNVNKRRAFLEDLERYQYEHSDPVPLDGNAYLIGFENGVFDSQSCIFRPHSASDYLTTLIPYDLHENSDTAIRSEIERVVSDILPDANIRNFVLLMLSLSLEGMNRHDIAMIWTGVGGNGKTLLKSLMKQAFHEKLHREPPATFLTAERPSADRPNPDLIDVMGARSLFTSEPQSGKKINTGFLKFLTGRDPVRVRNVHASTYFEYVPRFLVTLLTNAVPLLEGGDEDIRGIWRRLKIIHFETIFTDNPSPERPNERQSDPTLEEKCKSWGPDFMRLLVDIYCQYVRNGRRIQVPHELTLNLQEQREENSPFDTWLQGNLVIDPNTQRIHVHRLEKAYGSKCRNLVNRLKALGHQVGAVDDKQKDSGCCSSAFRYVRNVNVRNWSETERRVVDEH